MTLNIFSTILVVLAISLFVNAIFQKIKLPVILGYILVGVLVGPNVIGIVAESKDIRHLAEFGIVFLLFTIGLEFSLTRLLHMKKIVFGLGGLQVILTVLICTFVGTKLNMNIAQSIVIGTIIAMSSTAIVLKQLNEQLELQHAHGQNALGILLLQDLAVIPALMLIPQLSDINIASLSSELSWAITKAGVSIVAIFFIGKRLLRPIYYSIANVHSLELFTLTTLLITLSIAWLTEQLGLSLTLGAFLAGMMLGETEFKHQIETDIRPFRDVLLGFFFITIGMQFNVSIVKEAWQWMLLLVLALFLFKSLLIIILAWFFSPRKSDAIRTGFILAHGGEFGFAILALALNYEILPYDYGQVIIGSLLLSMCLAPILIKYNNNIAEFFISKAKIKNFDSDYDHYKKPNHLSNHVIICGYGRVGQNIARFLEKARIQYVAFDLDPVRVKNARLAGDNVSYADSTLIGNLEQGNFHKAKAIVISFLNTRSSTKILEQVRAIDKKIPIIVRSHDDSETNDLYAKGATEVVPDLFEGSLMITSHILLFMKIPPQSVYKWIDDSRQNRYDLLRMVFPGQDSMSVSEFEPGKESLQVVTLEEDSYAVNKSLTELKLEQHNIKITAVRRGERRIIDPKKHFLLQAGDIVVLYGKTSDHELAENLLLFGE